MDFVDVLGPRPERREAFPPELLAETTDAELQDIVESASHALETPIALVSLVLDQVQWFKAHYGLPPDLAAARATRRDVSFCQFVVRDDAPFEVNDAHTDDRIPQHLPKEYDVRSYLGIPIHVDETVVGSLCVLDVKPRSFSSEERARLQRLAARVDDRLAEICKTRSWLRAALTERSSAPALDELLDGLASVRSGARAGAISITAVQSYHRLFRHYVEGGVVPPAVLQAAMEAADEAVLACEDAFEDIEVTAGDSVDYVSALEGLALPAQSTRLAQVLLAAQDLARPGTRHLGAFALPDIHPDPTLFAPRPLAVGVLASALLSVTGALEERGAKTGVVVEVEVDDERARVTIPARELPNEPIRAIFSDLDRRLGHDPSIRVSAEDSALVIEFRIASMR